MKADIVISHQFDEALVAPQKQAYDMLRIAICPPFDLLADAVIIAQNHPIIHGANQSAAMRFSAFKTKRIHPFPNADTTVPDDRMVSVTPESAWEA